MPNFKYVAISDTGQVKSGEIAAASRDEARQKLLREGWFVTKLGRVWWSFRGGERPLSPARLMAISRELATLLKGRVTLPAALEVLAGNESGYPAAVLRKVKQAIEEGMSPAKAFASQAQAFEPTFLQMVVLGEKSGELPGALEQYTAYLRRQNALRTKIIQASYYPAILLLVIGLAVSILLLFSVPRFARMYDDLGAPLPAATEFLLALSNHFPFVLLGLTAVAALGLASRQRAGGVLRRLPVLREMAISYERARFMRSMATLLVSGMHAIDALQTTAEMMKGSLSLKLQEAAGHINAGGQFSQAVANTGLLTPTGMSVIQVAEHTGTLPTQAAAIASFYEEDLDQAVTRVLAIIEPMMILTMGVVVGAIVLAMYMPIFSIAASIR